MTTTTASIGKIARNIGIDISKDTLDLYAYETDHHWQVANSQPGIRRLVDRLKRLSLERLIVEASGGYERRLVEACIGTGLPLIVVQPVQSRWSGWGRPIRSAERWATPSRRR